MNIRVAGVVVLYNPELKMLNNINTYLDNIDILYVVDNSEQTNKEVVNKISNNNKIIYIPFGENKGIAYALNHAANTAYANGYKWLLTMDQDSNFKINMFATLLLTLKNIDSTNVGIISPVHQLKHKVDFNPINKLSVVTKVMTSGNLVNLLAWKSINGFDENLFIDEVDHDFCLRLNNDGFKVIINHSAVLEHYVGNYTRRKFFWGIITISTTNHNYIRRYYITRNKLYMMKKHHIYINYVKELRYDLCCVLFKEGDKLRKLKSFLVGIVDYMKGNMGKKIFRIRLKNSSGEVLNK